MSLKIKNGLGPCLKLGLEKQIRKQKEALSIKRESLPDIMYPQLPVACREARHPSDD